MQSNSIYRNLRCWNEAPFRSAILDRRRRSWPGSRPFWRPPCPGTSRKSSSISRLFHNFFPPHLCLSLSWWQHVYLLPRFDPFLPMKGAGLACHFFAPFLLFPGWHLIRGRVLFQCIYWTVVVLYSKPIPSCHWMCVPTTTAQRSNWMHPLTKI